MESKAKALFRLVALLLLLSGALRVDHVREGALVAEGDLVDKVNEGANEQASRTLKPMSLSADARE